MMRRLFIFLFRLLRNEILLIFLGIILIYFFAKAWMPSMGSEYPLLLDSKRPPMPPAFARWVDKAIPIIYEDINKKKGDINAIAVHQFNGDPTGYVSESMRIEVAKNCILSDIHILYKVYCDWFQFPYDPNPGPLTEERAKELQKYAAAVRAQAVIWGSVTRMQIIDDIVDAEISYCLIDAKEGKTLFTGVCNNNTLQNANVPVVNVTWIDKFRELPWLTRMLIWLVSIAVIAYFSCVFLNAILTRPSTPANKRLLIGLTMLDAIALYFIAPPNFEDMKFFAIFFLLCLIFTSIVVNIIVMAMTLKNEIDIK